jgi:hypothetical protein
MRLSLIRHIRIHTASNPLSYVLHTRNHSVVSSGRELVINYTSIQGMGVVKRIGNISLGSLLLILTITKQALRCYICFSLELLVLSRQRLNTAILYVDVLICLYYKYKRVHTP